MVLENREPDMAPHSKIALDIAAAADTLFKGDVQRHHELLHGTERSELRSTSTSTTTPTPS